MAAEDRLIEALEELTDKIDEMSGKLGRGRNKNQHSGTHAKTPEEKALAEANKEKLKMEQMGVDTQKKSNKANREQTESVKELTKSQRKAKEEQEKLEASMKNAQEGFKTFGKSLLDDKAQLSGTIGKLGDTLSQSYGIFGRTIGGVATGVGYALGAMQNFAESAKDMGAFADLSAFQVGSVRQAKVLSGLGDSFIKVIEQSNGTFKALGGNSQDAVENLSNLSRSLRYGSSYLNSAMKKSLGTDLIKSVDKAARATAAMGLSTEDQANLEGSILASTMLNAKNEDDAKRKFVTAMTESVTSARNLSNAFGESAKTVLAAMAEFRKTQAGTLAGLEGNKGAQDLYAVLKQFPSLGTDPAKLANVASALAEGNLAKAQYNTKDNPEANALLQQLFQASQGAVGKEGLDTAKFNKNIDSLRGSIELEYESRKSQQGYNDKYAAPAIEAMAFLRKRDIASSKIAPDEAAAKEKAGSSETDNIHSMNKLTAALESLRGVIVGLTAGILALLGPLASIALSGGLGGMLATKGLKGTLLALAKMPFAIVAATTEFYKAQGGFKGMWESTKNFAGGLRDTAKAMYDNLGGIKGMWESTKEFSKNIWDATKTFGAGLWDSTKALYANLGGLTGMLKSVKNFGLTVIEAGANAAKSLWTMAVTIFQNVVPALVAMARSAWTSMMGGFGNLGKVLGPVAGWFGKIGPWLGRIGGIFVTWGSKLLPLLGTAFEVLTGPIGWLIAGATLLYTFWDDIVDVSKAVWDGFTSLVGWLADGAEAIWDVITAPFTALFDWLGNSWLGKKLGFGSDNKETADSGTSSNITSKRGNSGWDSMSPGATVINEDGTRRPATVDEINAAKSGQLGSVATPTNFAPSPMNNEFGKVAGAQDSAKAGSEGNILKDIASTLTPEAMSQLMGYLSSMQSDLSAIRGNTKSDPFTPPVRLA